MKTNNPMGRSLTAGLALLLLAGILITLNSGCGKNSGPASGRNASAVVPVEKTSFAEVTSQLDPGGNFYVYLGTAQWLDGLSTKVAGWRQAVTGFPNLKPEDATNVNKAFDLVTRLVKDSGIEDVSGVGASSVEIERGMYRNKAVLHHYEGKGTGFLWQLAGKEAHPLTGLDYLPADTALAVFSDLNVSLIWSVAQKEVAQSELPQAQKWLEQLPARFEQGTQMKWETFINSLGGQFGLVITLDPTNKIPLPLPSGALEIPTPGLLLAVEVNDDSIFNRIDEQLKANRAIIRVDQPGFKMRTMPVPIPFLGQLRPSAASDGGYLFLATSDALINEALAVKDGQKPGLKASDEFKHLSAGLPVQGNHFVFLSQRLTKVMMQVQQQALAANVQAQPQMAQWLQSFYRNRPAFAYSIGMNTPEGCVTVGNGSQSYANAVLLPAIAVPAILAGVAIPNFVKARAAAQQNSCLNNLRQLSAAKQEWALEKRKTGTDVPTTEDLMPYLKRWPVCPQGGQYTIGPVNEPPKCSIPGHVLP
ncbi:MAG TPA: hypothetical protein VL970_08775 [Candidatus Acidoferrales bacterium]|nr:hypothetical protein [Candidatus Acidoferrales bacterium]